MKNKTQPKRKRKQQTRQNSIHN